MPTQRPDDGGWTILACCFPFLLPDLNVLIVVADHNLVLLCPCLAILVALRGRRQSLNRSPCPTATFRAVDAARNVDIESLPAIFADVDPHTRFAAFSRITA